MNSRLCAVALCVMAIGACSPKDDSAPPAAAAAPPATAGSAAPADATPPVRKGIPAPADVAAPPANALKTPSGIASRVLRVGLGSIHPKPTSMVTVYYTGWKTDGTMFDECNPPKDPLSFPLDQVIQGWTEGLQLMVKGEKRRFWIPGALGYDNINMPGSPKGTLVFDIELLDIR